MNTLEQCQKYLISKLEEQLGPLANSGLFSIKSIVGTGGKELKLYRPWFGPHNYATINFHGMGNPDAIRGGAYHFGFHDETEQMPPGVLEEVIMPMYSRTEGVSILSGTVKGYSDFYKKALEYDARQKAGDRTYCYIDHDVFTSHNFSKRIIQEQYGLFSKESGGFYTEHMNNPFMSVAKTNPFVFYFSKIKEVKDFFSIDYSQVNIVLDRGVAGNMPYIAWQYDP